MPLTPPPSAPPDAPTAPGAAPSRTNPSTFRGLADAFVLWQVGFRDSLAEHRDWMADYVSWAATNVTELDALLADVQAAAAAVAGVTFLTSYAGADPSGLTLSDTAMASAIASGKRTIVVPDNTLFTFSEGVVLPDDVSLVGYGRNSVLRWVSNSQFIRLGNRSRARNFGILGEGNTSGKSAQSGIYVDGNVNWDVEDVLFAGLAGRLESDGGAIVVKNTQGSFGGGRISKPHFTNCYDALILGTRGEYVQVTAPRCDLNTGRAIYSAAGNFNIEAPKCTLNGVGIEIAPGENDSHGTIVGGNVNHNTTNLKVGAIANGLEVIGMQMHAGNVEINGATGVDFIGSAMASGTLTLTGSCLVAFRGGRLSSSMTQVLNGNTIIQTAAPFTF